MCGICNKFFSSAYNVRRHSRIAHGENQPIMKMMSPSDIPNTYQNAQQNEPTTHAPQNVAHAQQNAPHAPQNVAHAQQNAPHAPQNVAHAQQNARNKMRLMHHKMRRMRMCIKMRLIHL